MNSELQFDRAEKLVSKRIDELVCEIWHRYPVVAMETMLRTIVKEAIKNLANDEPMPDEWWDTLSELAYLQYMR
jgi:hypothetical protein